MQQTLFITKFHVEKRKSKYQYRVSLLGLGEYSMLSDAKIQEEIEQAKIKRDEVLIFKAITFACEEILRYNDFSFDSIEILSLE